MGGPRAPFACPRCRTALYGFCRMTSQCPSRVRSSATTAPVDVSCTCPCPTWRMRRVRVPHQRAWRRCTHLISEHTLAPHGGQQEVHRQELHRVHLCEARVHEVRPNRSACCSPGHAHPGGCAGSAARCRPCRRCSCARSVTAACADDAPRSTDTFVFWATANMSSLCRKATSRTTSFTWNSVVRRA